MTHSGKVLRIERVKPRRGKQEVPWFTPSGYCLGDPQNGSEKHHERNAVYVRTLDEAADLIGKGYSLRMTGPGKVPSLISPAGLRIIREDADIAPLASSALGRARICSWLHFLKAYLLRLFIRDAPKL